MGIECGPSVRLLPQWWVHSALKARKQQQLLGIIRWGRRRRTLMIVEEEERRKLSAVLNEGNIGAKAEDESVESDSLNLLEWHSVCQQVARFASTPMGREVCRKGGIPFGKNQEESEELLEQTASACLIESPLDFSGIVDVSDIIRSACSGNVLSVNELCVIEKMLSSSRRLYDQLQCCVSATTLSLSPNTCTFMEEEDHLSKGHAAFSPLLSIMIGANFCTSFAQELKMSLDSGSLSILDAASPSLSVIRTSRRQNIKALETSLLEAGEHVVSAGGMDSIIITTRRARQCVAVRASHRHLLPGGVVLDLSNSGSTVFMEPKAALELNNKEVELAAAERAEKLSILERLTQKLAGISIDVWILLKKVACLDLACAKAGHAQWLHSIKPAFNCRALLPKTGNGQDEGPIGFFDSFLVYIEGLSHPLLLGQAVMNPEEQEDIQFPVPVDFKVKSGVSVIVISGPNTGGKTASMKTLGVAVLMSKAGLFLPARGRPLLPWFDKVLADIGDSQSLEQSLSTFSGHIQRVCRIMEAGGSRSLVLLDEIGSGTDPSEGVALATSILQHLAEHIYLTVVTTHFTKLSSFKERRFEVASVEFDIETLNPKYKMLWGIAGQSNALDIASSLGVDESILERARHWMSKLASEKQEQRASQLMDPLIEQRKILSSQAEVAALVLSDAKKLHTELAAEADGLETRTVALRLQQEEKVKREIDTAKALMEEIVAKFEGSCQNLAENGKNMSMGEALSAISSVVDTYMKIFGDCEKAHIRLEATSRPAAGDFVLIKRLGKNLATVIEGPAENDESFLVQLGGLKLRAKLSEVAKILKKNKSARKKERESSHIDWLK